MKQRKPKIFLDLSSYYQEKYFHEIREHLVEIKNLTFETNYKLNTPKEHKDLMNYGIKLIFDSLDMIFKPNISLIRIDKKRRKRK